MTSSNVIRKQFLADPVTQLLAENQQLDANDIARLKGLHFEYKSTKKQLKSLKAEKGTLSRKIGVLKKEGKDTAQILHEVNDVSVRLNEQNKLFKQLEQKILAFSSTFAAELNIDEALQASLPLPDRRYIANADPASQYSICELVDEVDRWDDFVRSVSGASIYHLSEWKSIIETCFGHKTHYIFAQDKKSNIVGVLPLVRLKSALFGDFLVSIPYFNYGGALAATREAEASLIKEAATLASELGVKHIEFRDELSRDGWQVRTDKVSMVLPLPETSEMLSQKLGSKLRAQIKRSQRENLAVVFGREELINDFYSVYSRNMRDLGTPVYGVSFFKEIVSRFKDCHIAVVRHKNKPVATGFLLGYDGTLEIPWASTLREANRFSANMFLYWEILCFAIQNRYHYFDFGRSTVDAGTYQFKKQWGALEKQLYWHYWLKDGGDLPMMNPSNPKYKMLINIWKRLPVAVANSIGPLVVKNLP